jgi:hypothetical protein
VQDIVRGQANVASFGTIKDNKRSNLNVKGPWKGAFSIYKERMETVLDRV